MKKQLLSLTLAAVMLTGCAGNGSSSSDSAVSDIVNGTSGAVSGETKERTELTVAFLSDVPGITQFDLYVDKFNRSQDSYNIREVDYVQYNNENDEHLEGALKQLRIDVAAGDSPDIMILSDHSTIQLLGQKGALADLYEFMENDPEVNRDTLMPNVLSALESGDGCLYSIAPQFIVHTLAVKKKFGQRENWSVDDMISFYDNAPASADHLYDQVERGDMFNVMLKGMDYLIEYEKAKCYFDSEDFVKVLEFCNRFTDKVYVPEDPDGTYWTEMSKWLKNDRELLDIHMVDASDASLASDYSYLRDVHFGENFTFVGYPGSNGNGGKIETLNEFAIADSCSDKEGAWQFVRYFFNDENQAVRGVNETTSNRALYTTRARKDQFEKWLEKSRYCYEWSDEEQKFVKAEESDYKGTIIHSLSDEDVEEFRRYRLSCDTLYDSLDPEIVSICKEEAAAYFAGDCSAQQAADYIQNRCSIYVSENS